MIKKSFKINKIFRATQSKSPSKAKPLCHKACCNNATKNLNALFLQSIHFSPTMKSKYFFKLIDPMLTFSSFKPLICDHWQYWVSQLNIIWSNKLLLLKYGNFAVASVAEAATPLFLETLQCLASPYLKILRKYT